MEDSAVQVPAATSGRIFGDAAVWIEALPPLCPLLATFSGKGGAGIRRADFGTTEWPGAGCCPSLVHFPHI